MPRQKSQKKAKPISKSALVPRSKEPLPSGYAALLADLKARVRAAQMKAALSVNRELIQLYWDIGKQIVEARIGKAGAPGSSTG